jgi:ABC-2 type transport system permease protein
MRRALSIALLQFKIQLSSKTIVITMFGLPLLFTVIFGGMMGGGSSRDIPIAIVDNDKTFVSEKILDAVEDEAGISAIRSGNEELSKLFVDKKIAAGLIIPRGFQDGIDRGEKPGVKLVAGPESNLDLAVRPAVQRDVVKISGNYRTAKEYMAGSSGAESLESSYAKVLRAAKASEIKVRVSHPKTAEKKATSASNVGEVALGFVVMFVMMLIFSMAGVILREREIGTWGRLLSTPSKRLSIVWGYVSSFVLTGAFQFAVLIIASSLLFGIKWGPVIPLVTLAFAYIISAAGMGFFLAGIVKTPEQQGTIGSLFVTATSMLGGAFWPLDYVSPVMRRIGYLTPQAWAIDGLRDVMLRGGSLGDIVLPLAVLLAFGALFLTAGLARVRFE